ncbi:MAG: cytochrome c oxidase assembly protein, partial [Moraxellaceae bacterium]|nr:cytochrome c oxidase assembly protein [Moraxellaceae bacterium]
MTQTTAARKQLIWMTGGVLLMFVFAVFAMPPIYRVFCEITGLNGKPSAMAAGESTSVDLDREITVEFITMVDSALPWQFTSERRVIKVHPGEIHQMSFSVVNQSDV